MKLLKTNRILFFSLLLYLLGQVMIWYVNSNSLERIVLLVQELAYLAAIGISGWLLINETPTNKRKVWLQMLVVFFLVNLLLFIYWILKVHLNPDINWELQGNETEVDPWYIILFLPVLNLALAFLLVTLFFIFSSWNSKTSRSKK